VRVISGRSWFLGFQQKPPLRFQEPSEILVEDALKLKYLEGSATPCLVNCFLGYTGTVCEARIVAAS